VASTSSEDSRARTHAVSLVGFRLRCVTSPRRTPRPAQANRIRPPRPQPPVATPPAKRTRRSIVRGWLGQESFWRDVTTRTLATIVAAILAYLYALGAGYVSSPTGLQTLRGIAIPVFGLVIGSSMMWGPWVFNPKRFANQPLWVRRVMKTAEWALALFAGLSLFQILSGAFNDVWWAWPFNTPLYHVPMANEPH
jgi:hypothetical protein